LFWVVVDRSTLCGKLEIMIYTNNNYDNAGGKQRGREDSRLADHLRVVLRMTYCPQPTEMAPKKSIVWNKLYPHTYEKVSVIG